jgi:serine/threonine-protein kinase HipA
VKLDDPRYPQVPENESAMLTWARASGITVPDHELVAGDQVLGLPQGITSSAPVLAVRRYDRHQSGRIHQEDFAQVREVSPELKYKNASYEGLAGVINAFSPDDVLEYARRIAAYVVMGNLDAHLKNWSFIYPDGHTPQLSPAYDLVSVSSYPEFSQQGMAFALSGTNRTENITLKHFSRLAQSVQHSVDSVFDVVCETVARMLDTWSQVTRDVPVPEFVAAHIHHRLSTLPLVRDPA